MAKLTLNNIEAGYQSASAYNANNDLITSALENTLSRDGTSPNQMEANLDMNSFRILNLVDATTGKEPVTYDQLIAAGTFGITAEAPTNANLVNYTSYGTGAIEHTVESKLRESISVMDYGAVGDGVTDDSPAFSLAARAVAALNNIPGVVGTGLPHAPMGQIHVPPGNYLISSEVDTGGNEITWITDQAVIFSDVSKLNGHIYRTGQRHNRIHSGNTDYACGYSLRNNNFRIGFDEGAAVLGIHSPSQLGIIPERGSVGMYVDNASPHPTVNATNATYTANTVTIPAPSSDTLKKYRKGMIIDTKHTIRWSGVVESWNTDGSVITVRDGWYQQGGGGIASTPTDGTGLYLNAFTKIWAHNANFFLSSSTDSPTVENATGFELGMFNSRGDSAVAFSDTTNRCWGYDAVNLGTFKGQAAFIARNRWRHGFYSVNSDIGFKYQGLGDMFKGVTPITEQTVFVVNNTGGIHIGNQSTPSVTPIALNFHSSGRVTEDCQIVGLGGSATPTTGSLNFRAGLITTNCNEYWQAASTEDRSLRVGQGRNADGNSYIDLVGDNTNVIYGARFLRSAGENGTTNILHKGTGALVIKAEDAANIVFQTSSATTVAFKSNGVVNYVPMPEPASGVNGDVYFDSGTEKLRCFAAGVWNDLF